MLNQLPEPNRVFQALADPSRLAMFELLCRGPISVSDLARPFEMSLAAVVQQVQILEECGVIRTEKKGRVRTCYVEPKALTNAERWIASRRSIWERRLDRLGEVLEKGDVPGKTKDRKKKK